MTLQQASELLRLARIVAEKSYLNLEGGLTCSHPVLEAVQVLVKDIGEDEERES